MTKTKAKTSLYIRPELFDDSIRREEYLCIEKRKDQIEYLKSWRCAQIKGVSYLQSMIGALAGKQYSNRAQHFFLELLQNADDNEYTKGIVPSIEFELTDDKMIIRNNEVGFNPDNVWAITSAAKSTKFASKDNSYIGEKGIGFKSVFAVADWVEIHSNGYHFRLRDKEYIIPYWENEDYKGTHNTEIILHLNQNLNIRKDIKRGLREIVDSNLGMMLFLKKLRNVSVIIDGRTISSLSMKQRGDFKEISTNGQAASRYYIFKYQQKVCKNALMDRYEDLFTREDGVDFLFRDVIFAVPDLPEEALRDFKGRYFAFLQTGMTTGMPIHIQIDAETNTSRESFSAQNTSLWNRWMLANLEDQLCKLFEALAKEPNFKNRLPEYLPSISKTPQGLNEDLTKIHSKLLKRIPLLNIFLNYAGKTKPASELVYFENSQHGYKFTEKKYQKRLRACFEHASSDTLTMICPEWNFNYKYTCDEFMSFRLESSDLFTLLIEGPPETIDIDDDDSVYRFLEMVENECYKIEGSSTLSNGLKTHIQEAKIFPVKTQDGKGRVWKNAAGKPLRWMYATSKNTKLPSKKYDYIDAAFTYNPGSMLKNRQDVSDRNSKIRNFLKLVGVQQHSILRSLIDEQVNGLRRSNIDAAKAEKLLIIVFDEYWKKRATREDKEPAETRDEFKNLMREIHLPVVLANQDATITVQPINKCFVADHYHAKETELFKAYYSTNAPIVNFAGFSSRAKIKWNEWTDFLLEYGAHDKPYLEEKSMSADPFIPNTFIDHKINTSLLDNDIPFFSGIREALCAHPRFNRDKEWFTIISNTRLKHSVLDWHSQDAISISKRSTGNLDYFTHIFSNGLYKYVNQEYELNVSWKGSPNTRIWVNPKYFETRIAPSLLFRCVGDDKKYFTCKEVLILDTPENRRIVGGLYHNFVSPKSYGDNIDFLNACGIVCTINHTWINNFVKKHVEACHKRNDQVCFDNYVESLRLLCRYLTNAHDIDALRDKLQVYNKTLTIIQSVRVWLLTDDVQNFPIDIVSSMEKAFMPEDKQTLEDAVNSIFKVTHSLNHDFYRRICLLGKLAKKNPEKARDIDFAHKMAHSGISLGERVIRNKPDLPRVCVLCFEQNEETRTSQDLWLIDARLDNTNYLYGLELLAWPVIEIKDLDIVTSDKRELSCQDKEFMEMFFESHEDSAKDHYPKTLEFHDIRNLIKQNRVFICSELTAQSPKESIEFNYLLLNEVLLINEPFSNVFNLLAHIFFIPIHVLDAMHQTNLAEKAKISRNGKRDGDMNSSHPSDGNNKSGRKHEDDYSNPSQDDNAFYDYYSEVRNAYDRPQTEINENSHYQKPDNSLNHEQRSEKEYNANKDRIITAKTQNERQKVTLRKLLEGPDPKVRAVIQNWYGGRCQFCGCEHNFTQSNGEPFYVVYYIVDRSISGHLDNTGNTLCLCANHFAKLRHGSMDGKYFSNKLQELNPATTQEIRFQLCGKEEVLRFHSEHIVAHRAYIQALEQKKAETEGD